MPEDRHRDPGVHVQVDQERAARTPCVVDGDLRKVGTRELGDCVSITGTQTGCMHVHDTVYLLEFFVNKSARSVADGYRSAYHYPGLVAAQRKLFGSALGGFIVVGAALAASSDAPALRLAFMVCFLSVLLGIIRVIVDGCRFNAEVGLDERSGGTEAGWLWFFIFKDMVTRNSKWRRRKSG